MNLQAATTIELIAALRQANANPAEEYHITLTSKEYLLTTVQGDLFGPVGLPIIRGKVIIEGHDATITRAKDAPPFRLLAVNANSGNADASLEIREVLLENGDSGNMGGGAIVNDGLLTLVNCALRATAARTAGRFTRAMGI